MGENFPVSVKMSADLTQASTNAVQGVCEGVRSMWNTLTEVTLGGKVSKLHAQDKIRQAQADVDAALIRGGYAHLDAQGNVIRASPEEYAHFLRQQRARREEVNLAATLHAATCAIESDPAFKPPKQRINIDFLDLWQDMAEKANDNYARRLWGKILKGELERPGSFPLKTLEIIRRLTQKEANLFTKIARYAIFDWILDFSGSDLSQKNIFLLYEAGLLLSWEKK